MKPVLTRGTSSSCRMASPARFERAQLGLSQARAGRAVDPDELQCMARVELTAVAVPDLDRLIRTHSLPADTKDSLRVPNALVGGTRHAIGG